MLLRKMFRILEFGKVESDIPPKMMKTVHKVVRSEGIWTKPSVVSHPW